MPTSARSSAISLVQAEAATGDQQKQLAQQGDSGSKKDMRAELLRADPKLQEQIRQARRVVGEA